MQDQPQDIPKRTAKAQARLAARTTEDAFKGGEGATGRVRKLTRPWNVGAGRLWEAARRREISGED